MKMFDEMQQWYIPKPAPDHDDFEEIRTLWIGDLADWMDKEYLMSCFGSSEEIESVEVVHDKQTNQADGYALIEFTSHDAAKRNLETCKGTTMPRVDQQFRMNYASFSSAEHVNYKEKRSAQSQRFNQSSPQGTPSEDDLKNTTIIVANLDVNVKADILQYLFRYYGKLLEVVVLADKQYGFVQFAERISAEEAMSGLNGTVLGEKSLQLSWYRTPSNKQ